jgi:translation initiation factor eIF-2B subunit beta
VLGADKSIRQVEGSQATARETAVLLRYVISQQRVPHSNQAASLIEAVKSVGVKLIAANPVGLFPFSVSPIFLFF